MWLFYLHRYQHTSTSFKPWNVSFLVWNKYKKNKYKKSAFLSYPAIFPLGFLFKFVVQCLDVTRYLLCITLQQAGKGEEDFRVISFLFTFNFSFRALKDISGSRNSQGLVELFCWFNSDRDTCRSKAL